ncbi:RNA-binding S4 domain-containing protein [Halalkalibacterium halodurans]|uniref:RNA-binding S4 domain-containing protein n=1 Tax=Halalkalibacterium halodurans TaxID=86665 RepID=UPI002E1BF43A|nr:RNA-binding S4 domain-containing protein [Halalkalibacterium halodurans]
MRLDKFLKVSRLIKRRTLAKEVCEQGRITVNGNVAKAGTVVKEGDELVIRFGQKLVTVEITNVKETVRKEKASTLYEVKKEEPISKSE